MSTKWRFFFFFSKATQALLCDSEKAVSIRRRARQDCKKEAMLLAKVYYASKQFLRAHSLLEQEQLLESKLEGRLLGAKCLLAAEDGEGALDLIGEHDGGWQEWGSVEEGARAACVRGAVYERLDNRPQATHWYVEALRRDPWHYEALCALRERHLLTQEHEEELRAVLGDDVLLDTTTLSQSSSVSASVISSVLSSSPQQQQHQQQASVAFMAPATPLRIISESELRWELLASKINLYSPAKASLIRNRPSWELDIDLCTTLAETLYRTCRFSECQKVCKSHFSPQALSQHTLTALYVACMVETRDTSELYYVAHQLVEHRPNHALAWHAVACYYMLIGKYDNARHYFRRSTACDHSFGEAWMGYAHAFAQQGEHDQAMAAYRTCARQMQHSHLPPLCIGMEYLRVNNLSLAVKFIENASALFPSDPLVHNEMGVALYREGRYGDCLQCFQRVVQLVGGMDQIRMRIEWEPTLNNMAHAHRKLKNYNEATKLFFSCLSLKPSNASTLTSLALTYHLAGTIDKAIEYYHMALGLKPDDAFANDMLKRALDEFNLVW